MSAQKLTKKQKKALAFRDRKGKGKAKAASFGEEVEEGDDYVGNALPVEENQELLGLQASHVEPQPDDDEHRAAKKAQDRPAKAVVVKQAKRKREAEGEEGEKQSAGGGEGPKRKKKKGVDEGDNASEGEGKKKEVKDGKQRYILFVGNLKYTTSIDAVRAHFSHIDPPPTVRLLTPKSKNPSTTGPPKKSKGCAFLEFTARPSLQEALKLHLSSLDGRQINVELTAGGGGKSEQRINKLRERNKELNAQRTKRLEKSQKALKKKTGSKTDSNNEAEFDPHRARQNANSDQNPTRPQRFSSTSGADAPLVQGQRTWAVGDEEDGEPHRGGQKHKTKKKNGKRPKFLATGVNAIPVAS